MENCLPSARAERSRTSARARSSCGLRKGNWMSLAADEDDSLAKVSVSSGGGSDELPVRP